VGEISGGVAGAWRACHGERRDLDPTPWRCPQPRHQLLAMAQGTDAPAILANSAIF